MEAKLLDFFKPSPHGSPDNYVTTRTVVYNWRAPRRFTRLVKCPVMTPNGTIWLDRLSASPRIRLEIRTGFFFGVSVAPSAPKALPAAAMHDLIYANVDLIARQWKCSVRRVLALADHWFLAEMRFTDFEFKRTYFIGVSLFGYWFNRIAKIIRDSRTPALPHFRTSPCRHLP